jgi:hypothetical protein
MIALQSGHLSLWVNPATRAYLPQNLEFQGETTFIQRADTCQTPGVVHRVLFLIAYVSKSGLATACVDLKNGSAAGLHCVHTQVSPA